MSGFLYFVENKQSITAMDLLETGLDKVLDDVVFTTRTTISGPGGGGGILISGKGAGAKELYFRPEKQYWQKAINDKFYIGIYSDAMPGPDELSRKRQINGHIVNMNGKDWIIPLARIFPEGSGLPNSLILCRDGSIKTEIISEYIDFSNRVSQLWEDFEIQLGLREGKIKVTLKEGWILAKDALTINYHLAEDEINLLKLFNSQSHIEILRAIVDIPTIESLLNQKKTMIKTMEEES